MLHGDDNMRFAKMVGMAQLAANATRVRHEYKDFGFAEVVVCFA
jgi:hypothetical protein